VQVGPEKSSPALAGMVHCSLLRYSGQVVLDKTMRRKLASNKYRTKPFSRFLALGQLQLEPLFFQLGVLGRYQSDPRYIFRFNGLDGKISVKTADYLRREMSEADKVGVETFRIGTSPKGHRVIVTFPRYLASMSSRHQQHWDSYRVHGKSKIEENYYLRGVWASGRMECRSTMPCSRKFSTSTRCAI
jgi:hypothetical protein